jgi:hypothetical protein
MEIPIMISANATSQTRIRGSMTTATPKIMNKIPGTMNINPDPRLDIIPLHVSAIGHIVIGVVSVIVFSTCFLIR